MLSKLAVVCIFSALVFGDESSTWEDEGKGIRKSTRSPVYRYWNGIISDHFYTTNNGEIGAGLSVGQSGAHGYVYEGIGFYLSKVDNKKTIPLYRYYLGANGDHFYTTNAAEIGTTTPGATGNHGYKFESTLGYCFQNAPKKGNKVVALYRYYNPLSGDHFYTTNAAEIGTTTPGATGHHGYKFENIPCYVYNAETRTIDDELNESDGDDIDYEYEDLEEYLFGADIKMAGQESILYNNWMAIIGIIGTLVMIIAVYVYYKKEQNKKKEAEAAKALLEYGTC